MTDVNGHFKAQVTIHGIIYVETLLIDETKEAFESLSFPDWCDPFSAENIIYSNIMWHIFL